MGDLANLASRFPHLGEAIFDQVDDKTLINCRKMSQIWCQIIDGQRNTWLRLLKKYIGKFDDRDDVTEKLWALYRLIFVRSASFCRTWGERFELVIQ